MALLKTDIFWIQRVASTFLSLLISFVNDKPNVIYYTVDKDLFWLQHKSFCTTFQKNQTEPSARETFLPATEASSWGLAEALKSSRCPARHTGCL